MVWLHLLFALAVNAIPAWGVFTQGWSVGVLLILFWWENLLGVLLQALRLKLHQRRSRDPVDRDAAQWRRPVDATAQTIPSHAQAYLSNALPFALAHGVFAVLLPLAFGNEGQAQAALWWPRLDDLQLGAALVAATLLLDFALDLPGLARRSFEQVKSAADARFARVLTLHVVIIFGALAASQFESPYGMLAVMLGLKTLVDVGLARVGHAPG